MAEENGHLPSTRLDGKVALVTGAGRGIGRGCALGLAEAGAEVVAWSRTAGEIESVVAEIEAAGGKARARTVDVTDDATVRQAVGELDRIDILFNNAGSNKPQDFLDVDADSLDTVLDLNIRAAFIVAQAVAARMVAQGEGAIINMSSTMGRIGGPRRSVYCTTKHAIEGLTKALACELGLIPKLADKDPFDRFPLTARQARFARRCSAPQAERNAASGQGIPARGWGFAARRVRCGPCPMRGIAPRTAPARRAAEPHQMGLYRRALV